MYTLILQNNMKELNQNFKTGTEITFRIESVSTPPTSVDNGQFCIAFIPELGFMWCKYYTGSKVWVSPALDKNVEPTHWLKFIK